jgi:hypothetical protein
MDTSADVFTVTVEDVAATDVVCTVADGTAYGLILTM